MSNITKRLEEAIVKSFKTVPVDVGHLKKGELAAICPTWWEMIPKRKATSFSVSSSHGGG